MIKVSEAYWCDCCNEIFELEKKRRWLTMIVIDDKPLSHTFEVCDDCSTMNFEEKKQKLLQSERYKSGKSYEGEELNFKIELGGNTYEA